MLTLTQNATLIVKEIADQQGGAEGTGLRITAGVDEPGLTVTTAELPEPGDQVLEQDGATVYLDEGAATMLDDKVLDAERQPEFSKVQKLWAESNPVVYLVANNILVASNKRLGNFQPVTVHPYATWNSEQLFFKR